MTSVIIGDIINSQEKPPQQWLEVLKTVLNTFGPSPTVWEIYRGDSFQIEVEPKHALRTCILIKANIKQFDGLDARLAIGIGDKTYHAEKITEANGSAFVNSGDCFENLKKTTLALKSPFEAFDDSMNLMLQLALLTMDYWTSNSATLVKTALEHPDFNQSQIAAFLGKTQGNISQGLKRAGFDEISKLIKYFNNQTQQLC